MRGICDLAFVTWRLLRSDVGLHAVLSEFPILRVGAHWRSPNRAGNVGHSSCFADPG